MEQDTQIGGPSQFPLTQWSAIVAAASDDADERSRAFDVIIQAYWKPVYKTIRIKWHKSNEDAKDLTQAFFATALEKDYFKDFDPEKARFRTFLRTCLHGFVANSEKAARRLKRGGDLQFVPLDFDSAENELSQSRAAEQQTLDDYFYQEWLRHLFSLAVQSLQAHLVKQDKKIHFELFQRYDLAEERENVTYEALAAEYNLPVTKITNYLALARREFRRTILEKLREITMTEAEFRSEASVLLGSGVHGP